MFVFLLLSVIQLIIEMNYNFFLSGSRRKATAALSQDAPNWLNAKLKGLLFQLGTVRSQIKLLN